MRVAVIGRGFGAHFMAPAYEAQGFTVELIPSREAAAVEAACRGGAELISIHSPPFQHQAHVLAALAAGKHVLCDKPFGTNGVEARIMRDAAKRAGSLHFLNFEFRRNPAFAKARALIVEGAIGALSHVGLLNYGNGLRGRPHGWLNDESLGGGWVGAYGSHVIDHLRFFFGREVADCGGITRVETRSRPDGAGGEAASTAEDSFSCWFAMAGGGTASIDTSYAAPVTLPQSLHLLGSDGALTIAGNLVTLHRPRQKPEEHDCPPPPGLGMLPAVGLWLADVKAALQSGTQIAPNFDDGVAVAEVMDRLRANVSRIA